MRSLQLLAFLGVLLGVATASCIGSNDKTEDLATQLKRYPDKGRKAIDPISTPGFLTLTFDDGPGPYTKDIVDVLARHKVEGTFFCVGRLIPGRRDILEYIASHGQQLANHSYNHEPQPALGEAEFKERVLAVQNNIGDLDHGRLYFRFPFGAAEDKQLTWLSQLELDGHRFHPVGWHTDSQDFDFNRKYPAETFSSNVTSDDNVEGDGTCAGQPNPFTRDMVGWTQFIARKVGGGVMLFHDTALITRDKLDEILRGFESPEAYWAALPAQTRAEYERYYACQDADPLFKFEYQPLWTGAWPSLLD